MLLYSGQLGSFKHKGLYNNSTHVYKALKTLYRRPEMITKEEINTIKTASDTGRALYDYILARQRGIRGNAPMDLGKLSKEMKIKGYAVDEVELKSLILRYPKIWSMVESPNRRPKIIWRINPYHIAKLVRGGTLSVLKERRMLKREHMAEMPQTLSIKINGVRVEAGLEEMSTIFKVVGLK